MPTIIAHGDADGVISTSLILRVLGEQKVYIYFTSPAKLRDTICSSISGKSVLDIAYIVDLSGNRQSVYASAIYDKAVWIDHHIWKIDFEVPKNVEIFFDSDSESASKVVAKYFGIESRLVEIANEIDKNNVQSEDAEFFRNLIGSIKKEFSGVQLAFNLRKLAKELALEGLDGVKNKEEYKELVEKYRTWLKELDERIKDVKIFDVNGKKVAILKTITDLPIYYLTNKLKEHEEAPFDYICVMTYKVFKNKSMTKLEFRTHTNKDVLSLALKFGGGGHRVASGATVLEHIDVEKVLEKISELNDEGADNAEN